MTHKKHFVIKYNIEIYTELSSIQSTCKIVFLIDNNLHVPLFIITWIIHMNFLAKLWKCFPLLSSGFLFSPFPSPPFLFLPD